VTTFHLAQNHKSRKMGAADKLSRDKSSIHPHIKNLIKMGFISKTNKVDDKICPRCGERNPLKEDGMI